VFANEGKVFPDVKSTHWAIDAIKWGTEKKIISGYPDGTFKPNNSVTEAEFLSMLLKAFGGIPQYTEKEMDYSSFQNLSAWSKPVYMYAGSFRYGDIFSQDMFGTYLPNTKASRLWVAELITATQGVHITGDFAIKYVLGNGLASGYGKEPSIGNYKPLGTLTRAEAIKLIENLLESGVTKLVERPMDTTNIEILNNLPIVVSGKTMFDKIQGIITDSRYVVDVTLSGDAISIQDTTKPGREYKNKMIYYSILVYHDRRLSEGSVGIVNAYQPENNDTYIYLKKIFELLSVPKADEVIQVIKSQYDKGEFNTHGQKSLEKIVGNFKLNILMTSNSGFNIGIEKIK
jgi:hypothetical protein